MPESQKMPYKLQQELRHVKDSKLTLLSNIIDQSKSYNDLLKQMSSDLYPSMHITIEFVHLIKRQPSPTLALLNHWKIIGRKRPKVLDLINLLRACELRRAEVFVWREILDQEPTLPTIPHKPQHDGANESGLGNEYMFNDLTHVISSISGKVTRYPFDSIYESTNKFCHNPLDHSDLSGFKIGDGRFSTVFLAQASLEANAANDDEQQVAPKVAAKLLKSECNLHYLVNEINLAQKIRHENILELLGISIGYHEGILPNYMCLIYPYMKNGSLFECLNYGARCNEGQRIPWEHRIEIAFKVAKGIAYLHTFPEGVIIHRDIKTANILIDENLSPKLGDFTLVRQLDSFKQGATEYSQNVIGTSVYMPPEAFRGDISTKFDVFSFGVVLLEMLTGLKPFNDDRDEDLLTYISDKLSDIEENPDETSQGDDSYLKPRYRFLKDALDSSAGNWDIRKAGVIFDSALMATEVRKKDRPEIMDILSKIQDVFR